MVKKLLKVFSSSTSDIHYATYIIAGLAFLSLLLGLVRDHLLASTFGAGEALDLYFASFRVPDIIYGAIASFMSVYALLPFFEEKELNKRLKEFVNNIFSFFFTLMIFLGVIAFIFMPFITGIFFSGFGEDVGILTTLSRILLLQMVFLGISSFFVSIAQFRHKFILYGLAPILYNLGIFIGILFLIPFFDMNPIMAVVFGVVIGSILHMCTFISFILSEKLLVGLVNPFRGLGDVKNVVLASLPRTVGLSLNAFSMFALVSIASTLTTGSISVLLLSYNLMHAPLTIVGISYSVAAFPMLARLFTRRDLQNFFEKLRNTFRHVIFWAVPVAFAFLVLRAHIVRLILGRGEFDWFDTRLTAATLILFAVVIIAQSISFLVIRASYAARNVIIPVIATSFSFVLVVSLSLYFIFLHNTNEAIRTPITEFLRVSGVPGTEVLMIPLAIAVTSVVQAFFLISYFQLKHKVLKLVDLVSFIKSVIAASVFLAFTYLSLQLLGLFIELDTFINVFAHGAISTLVGAAFWILALWWLDSEEGKHVWSQVVSVKNKLSTYLQ